MAGLQGLLHSPIEEGTPELIVAPSPIESSSGSKSGPSGPAKQRRKAVTAGPAETPRPASNKRTSSRASTRPPTPLTIQAPVPTFPIPNLNPVEDDAIVVSSREPTQEPLPQSLSSPVDVTDTFGKELGALNEGSVLETLVEMSNGASNISKLRAFDHILEALKEAKERGSLHTSQSTPTTSSYNFQTFPIPHIPTPEDLRVDDGSSEQLHHDIGKAVNTLSDKIDQTLMNQQFFLTQLIVLTNGMFRMDNCIAAIKQSQSDQHDREEVHRKIDNEILDKLNIRTHQLMTGLAATAKMVTDVGEKMKEIQTISDSIHDHVSKAPQPASPPRLTKEEKGKGPGGPGPQNEMEAARIIYNKVAQVETTVETIAKQVAQIQTEQQSLRASVTPLSQRVSFGPSTPAQAQVQTPAPPSRPPTPKPRPATPKPAPSTSSSALQQTPKMKQGEQFFLSLLAKSDPLQILRWARVISWGKWGPIASLNHEKHVPNYKGWNAKSDIEVTKEYIRASISRAFAPGSYGVFLLPPLSDVGKERKKSVNKYHWVNFVYSGAGKQFQAAPGHPVTVQEPPMGPWYEDLFSSSQAAAISGPVLPPITFPPPAQPQGPITSFFPIETPAVPAPQTEVPWTTVGPSKKMTYSSAAAKPPAQFSSTTPQVVSTVRRPAKTPTTNNWIIRFRHKATKEDDAMNRQNAFLAVKKINALAESNKNLHRFRCLAAKWTEGNNLSLQFSADTKDTALEQSRVSIIQALEQKENEVTFKKNVAWSKIVIRNVPAIAYDDEDLETRMWTSREIEAEVRKNEAFRNVEFTRDPAWACHPDTYAKIANLSHANVVLHFEDPDGSLAERLVKSDMWMFAAKVVPKHWIERIDLKQCTRCWALGFVHSHCQQYCRVCASDKHTEEKHNISCAPCVATFGEQGVRKEDFKCRHVKCKNCAQPQFADHQDCEARKERITQARANPRNRIPANQPIMTTDSYRPPRRAKVKPVQILPIPPEWTEQPWSIKGCDPPVDPRGVGHSGAFDNIPAITPEEELEGWRRFTRITDQEKTAYDDSIYAPLEPRHNPRLPDAFADPSAGPTRPSVRILEPSPQPTTPPNWEATPPS